MKIFKVIGILTGCTLLFGCSKEFAASIAQRWAEDSSRKTEASLSSVVNDYIVGEQVKLKNEPCDVIQNVYLSGYKIPDSDSNVSIRYLNDNLIRTLILQEFHLSKYIMLYMRDGKKTASQGSGILDEVYNFLNEEGEILLRFQFRFISSSMFPELKDPKAKFDKFMSLPEEIIRTQYTPDRIKIENKLGQYGDDYTKMKKIEITYLRNEDGENDFTKRESFERWESAVLMDEISGKKTFPVRMTDKYKDGVNYSYYYRLPDAVTQRLFATCEIKLFDENNLDITEDGHIVLSVNGDGQVNGNESDALYKSIIDFKGIDYENRTIKMTLKNPGGELKSAYEYNVKLFFSDGHVEVENHPEITKLSDLELLENGFYKDCIQIPEDWVPNAFPPSLPEYINITVPFANREAPLQKYMTVPLVYNDIFEYYEPDIDAWTEVYRKDFARLYNDNKNKK